MTECKISPNCQKCGCERYDVEWLSVSEIDARCLECGSEYRFSNLEFDRFIDEPSEEPGVCTVTIRIKQPDGEPGLETWLP